MKPTLASLFPNASQATADLNPQLSYQSGHRSGPSPILKPKSGLSDCTVRMGDKFPPRRGVMNKTEAEFALMLEAQKQNGEIRDYLFHPLSLPWAGMKYSPDFMVTPNSGLEKRRMIEVKGPHIHYEQQAIARFKGARAYWPEFAFEMWQKIKVKDCTPVTSTWKRKY